MEIGTILFRSGEFTPYKRCWASNSIIRLLSVVLLSCLVTKSLQAKVVPGGRFERRQPQPQWQFTFQEAKCIVCMEVKKSQLGNGNRHDDDRDDMAVDWAEGQCQGEGTCRTFNYLARFGGGWAPDAAAEAALDVYVEQGIQNPPGTPTD
ncbi:hypothetical protein F5Y04DRAFT_106725 [Hypomontagnella monticulosa]|nr:hypothetical protein F5Y04DRAFT_106725 [Hypomontagnella monticulosa]